MTKRLPDKNTLFPAHIMEKVLSLKKLDKKQLKMGKKKYSAPK